MSKPYKIFGHQRGIQPIQGRNAQMPMSMQKKPESLNDIPAEKYDISPFSGYNTPSNQNQNYLAYSQVSDPSLNQELMKKLIRQEVQKQNSGGRNRNQVNIIRTEIRTLKQFVQQIGEKSDKNLGQFQEIRGQLHDVMSKLIQDSKIQSAKNLREVFKKINENVRKDCLGHLRTQFVPIGFIQDAQKQFSQLEDRIAYLQSKGDNNKSRVSQDPVVLAETIDIRLKKVERQIEVAKKQSSEYASAIKQIEPALLTISTLKKKNQEFQQARIEEEAIKSRIRNENSGIQKQMKHIEAKIDQLKRQNVHITDKVKLLNNNFNEALGNLQNKRVSSNGSVEPVDTTKEFLNNSKNLAYSGVFQHQKSSESQQEQGEGNPTFQSMNSSQNNKPISSPQKQGNGSAQKQYKDLFQSPKKLNPPPSDQLQMSGASSKSDKGEQVLNNFQHNMKVSFSYGSPERNNLDLNKNNEKIASDKKIQQTESIGIKQKFQYRIDKDNHLLDENNSYIMDQAGRMVTLTPQQVQLLRSSTLVKLQE